jgi:hypothetical protein
MPRLNDWRLICEDCKALQYIEDTLKTDKYVGSQRLGRKLPNLMMTPVLILDTSFNSRFKRNFEILHEWAEGLNHYLSTAISDRSLTVPLPSDEASQDTSGQLNHLLFIS